MDVHVKQREIMKKTLDLPKIYYINLDSAEERNKHMVSMFEEYGISNYEKISGIYGKSTIPQLRDSQWGCLASHMKAIKAISEGQDEYAIIMEDDADISTSDMWDFTFDELVKKAKSFDMIQLIRCQNMWFTGLAIKKWGIEDRCTGAYLITKEHAKKLYQLYSKTEDLSHINRPGMHVDFQADAFLYSFGNVLSTVIFKMKLFPSQISLDGSFEKKCTDCLEALFSKKITLQDIFI